MRENLNNKREELFAKASIFFTLVCLGGLLHFELSSIHSSYISGNTRLFIEGLIFTPAILFTAYSSVLYQICLVGYYKRKQLHVPASREVLNDIYRGNAPSLSVLVPSYKEERRIIWQTLVSVALAEYPQKNVVLLIDDPYHAKALEDMIKIEDTRLIPGELQALFDKPAARFNQELQDFQARQVENNIHYGIELNRISMLYEEIAGWVENLAEEFKGSEEFANLPHSERFFVERILLQPVASHRQTANELRAMLAEGDNIDQGFIERHYARIAGMFKVNFSSFERKKYANLSHEANKAMNLNAYIDVIGKSWKEVEIGGQLHLVQTSPEQADFTIPAADYVNTIDADSVMLSDYLIRMIEMMQRPENSRLAVIQSSVSSFPGSDKEIERIASAGIDVQFRTHQGYTYWNATFWVGANAMLRYIALQDIKETRIEEGHEVAIYIQDRTVIEDTESTIDLVEKGWKLYNYPERMSFSAMPPDFGSLLIQRRRWSNGGLIILPKLFKYIAKSPKNLNLLKEFSMRFNYLAATTIGTLISIMFITYPFSEVCSTIWLPLSAVPLLLLYARDLKNTGYKYSDLFGICSLNLMLFPVAIGGVTKQFQQMLTGKKIPFGRTPKITGRTAAPAIYCLIEVAIFVTCSSSLIYSLMQQNWSKAAFAMINTIFIAYALVRFIGVKETFQDMFAGVTTYWKSISYRAEIIPISAIRRKSGREAVAVRVSA